MALEVAEIFRRYGEQYCQKYGERMPARHRQVMQAIQQCRTEALGGQTYRCPDCDHELYSYHSCRNRHCPKCQNENAQRWLEKQQHTLLPVPYFLLTFTLPEELGKVARSHPHLFYNLLFRISAVATQQLAADPRFIGGQIGMMGVLHTWGRNSGVPSAYPLPRSCRRAGSRWEHLVVRSKELPAASKSPFSPLSRQIPSGCAKRSLLPTNSRQGLETGLGGTL